MDVSIALDFGAACATSMVCLLATCCCWPEATCACQKRCVCAQCLESCVTECLDQGQLTVGIATGAHHAHHGRCSADAAVGLDPQLPGHNRRTCREGNPRLNT
jgi:hypothetical protein